MRPIDVDAIKTLDPDAVFSLTEAARLLGITHNGMLGKIHRNTIRYGKNGGRYYVKGRDIQAQVKLPGDQPKKRPSVKDL